SGDKPDSPPSAIREDSPDQQELERRRDIVRRFFNDFWKSADVKPVAFAERLNQAEAYINGRLAAGGETWQLNSATRKQLGLPPHSNHGNGDARSPFRLRHARRARATEPTR